MENTDQLNKNLVDAIKLLNGLKQELIATNSIDATLNLKCRIFELQAEIHTLRANIERYNASAFKYELKQRDKI